MENKTTFFLINSIAKEYLNGDEKVKKQSLEKLFTLIYLNLKDFKIFLDEDTSSDFILYVYPNLEKLLKKYCPEKSLFSTFLHMNLQYMLISFLRKKSKELRLYEAAIAEKTQTIISYMEEQFNEIEYAAENTVKYCSGINSFYFGVKPIRRKANIDDSSRIKDFQEKNVLLFFKRKDVPKQVNEKRKTVFFLACKAAVFLDDDIMLKIADYIDMPAHILKKYIEDLKQKSHRIIEKIEEHKIIRDKNYIKKIACEKRLNSGKAGNYEKELLLRAQKISSSRFKEAISKDKNQIKCPSNRLIAKILNISRSSVDKNIAKINEAEYNDFHENIFGIFQ